jgi:transcriptional regulator with XRE-family HTH domain
MEFKDFMDQEFRKWENRTGRRQNISTFARYLGVRQPSLSKWMSGAVIPDHANLDQLAKNLGSDVYKYAGQPERLPENTAVKIIARILPKLPLEFQERFANAVQNAYEGGGKPEDNQETLQI